MLKAKLTHRSTREVKMWKLALKTTHKLYILFHRWEYYIFLLVYFSRFVEKFKDKCIYFIENIKKHSFTYATPATKVSIIKYIVFEFPACLKFCSNFHLTVHESKTSFPSYLHSDIYSNRLYSSLGRVVCFVFQQIWHSYKTIMKEKV